MSRQKQNVILILLSAENKAQKKLLFKMEY